MSYIKEYYEELNQLIEDQKYSIARACKLVRDKYKLGRSVDGMRKAYVSMRNNLDFENDYQIRQQTVNGHGDLISEKRVKSQEKTDYNKDDFILERFTSNPHGPGIWGRYVNVELVTGYTAEGFKEALDKRKPVNYKIRNYKKHRSKTGVFMLADFHLGAYVGDLLKTPDFNFNVICEMLQHIAKKINEMKYRNVYLFCIGDFIESFSGLNHINSWKGLSKGAFGMQAIILAHEILSEHLYSKIHNLKYIGFVSGNHDRISSNRDEDQEGQVAKMMQYLFAKDFKAVKSEWNALLIKKKIDGIGYVVTHGHLGISDKEISKILFEYGFQGIYNIYAKGHKHTRQTKRTFKHNIIKYQDIDYVTLDSAEYRAVTVPPLFTGNFYSESLGYTSTAGFAHFVNNGKGKVTYIDYCV